MSWYMDLEPKLFSLIKMRTLPKLKEDFPKISFTSTTMNTSNSASFPTVYIHTLPGMEMGQDLEGSTVNGILYSLQIDVYTDKSQTDARKVMSVIADVLKEMRFTINTIPEFINETTVYRQTMRVRRIICSGDIF